MASANERLKGEPAAEGGTKASANFKRDRRCFYLKQNRQSEQKTKWTKRPNGLKDQMD